MRVFIFNSIEIFQSVEKEMREDTSSGATDVGESSKKEGGMDGKAEDELSNWIQTQLGTRAARVKVTRKLESHPCVITVEEMAAARHFIKTQGASFTEEQRSVVFTTQELFS